jgi:transcriptional regulator with XRE-family HTH domain
VPVVPGNASTSLAAGLAHTVVVMDNRAQVREFLVSRRKRISPAQAGLPAYGGGNRRVKGLRREEVALLAGVSIDYYVRMERGNLAGASEAVLDGIAGALQLDEAERAHLFDLARAAQPTPPRRRKAKASGVTDGIQQVLDAITDAPAWIRNAGNGSPLGSHDRTGMASLHSRAAPILAPVGVRGESSRCSGLARRHRWAGRLR